MLKGKLITQENAKFLCQACLIQLDIESGSSFTIGKQMPAVAKDRVYFVHIKENKQFQDFMTTNIGAGDNSLLQLQQYPQHICLNCYRKWHNLEKFCQKAQQSAKVLHSVFQDNLKLENTSHSYHEVVNRPVTRGSEKPKKHETFANNGDALLETEAITLWNSKNLVDIEKFDVSIPDPFSENEQMLESINTKDELKEGDEEMDVYLDNELEDYESDQDYIPTRKATITPSQKQQPKKRGQKNISGIIRKRVAAYRCDKCKRRFARQFHYEAHMLKVHEGSTHPYKCKECGKFYKAVSALNYHMYVSHELGEKRFPCGDCRKEYKTEQSLRTHRLAQHLGQKRSKRFICELCGAAFINQQSLTIHNNAKHSSNDGNNYSKEYKCHNCDKLFQSPYTLKYHILRNHTQETHFKCDVCGAGFAKKFMVFAHMRTHISDSERVPCPQCEKRFLSKSDAKKHVAAVHLKIKPYLCVYCGEAFGTPKTLRHHVYIHTGEKPYVCDVCGQGFRQPTSMKTHRNTHFKKLKTDPNTTHVCD